MVKNCSNHRQSRGFAASNRPVCGPGGAFWAQMQAKVLLFADIGNGILIKSIVFAGLANWIALFEGYEARPTSEGVSLATTRTVVITSLAVLGWDFLLTALMFGAW